MVSRVQDRASLPVKLEIIDVEKRKGLSKYYVSPELLSWLLHK